MTVQELYQSALNLIFDKPKSRIYDHYYMDHINSLLAEVFDINNSIRIKVGKSELTNIPFVTKDNDVIDYEEVVLRDILPWGLAAQLVTDEDLNKFQIYYTRYSNACNMHNKAIVAEIGDYYV